MTNDIVAIILLTLAFILKALADSVKFHWHSTKKYLPTAVVEYFDPNNWRSFWKNGDATQGERFFGSSRWFAPFLDGWHLLDASRNYLGILSVLVAINKPMLLHVTLDAFVLFCMLSLLFELIFTKLSK